MRIQRSWVVMLAVAASCTGAADGNEKRAELVSALASEAIPLKTIWAWKMPETRNIGELEKTPAGVRSGDICTQIVRSLSKSRAASAKAGSIFVVPGTGKQALQNAYDVLVKDAKPAASIPADQPCSVVFYSHSSNQYVHLKKVSKQGSDLVVAFGFIPHKSKEMTSHFALIPLTGWQTGKHGIKVTNTPLEKKHADAGFKQVTNAYVDKVVCRSTHVVACRSTRVTVEAVKRSL